MSSIAAITAQNIHRQVSLSPPGLLLVEHNDRDHQACVSRGRDVSLIVAPCADSGASLLEGNVTEPTSWS